MFYIIVVPVFSRAPKGKYSPVNYLVWGLFHWQPQASMWSGGQPRQLELHLVIIQILNVYYSVLPFIYVYFNCSQFSKTIQTGLKRANNLIRRPYRRILLRLRMTQIRASTSARAYAPRDHYIHNVVTPTKPRTSVRIPESSGFNFIILPIICLLINCVFYVQFLVLKRRVLLSISGCIFFGIIAVFIGCIVMRVLRKPGLWFLSVHFLNVLHACLERLVFYSSLQLKLHTQSSARKHWKKLSMSYK